MNPSNAARTSVSVPRRRSWEANGGRSGFMSIADMLPPASSMAQDFSTRHRQFRANHVGGPQPRAIGLLPQQSHVMTAVGMPRRSGVGSDGKHIGAAHKRQITATNYLVGGDAELLNRRERLEPRAHGLSPLYRRLMCRKANGMKCLSSECPTANAPATPAASRPRNERRFMVAKTLRQE